MQLASFMPERKAGRRGTKPISPFVLLDQLFILFKTNCGWRNIKHTTTCWKYFREIQRRGLLTKFLNWVTESPWKNRPSKCIVDTSDIVSYKTTPYVAYSGKYHNYCLKFSLLINEKYVPLIGNIYPGAYPDSTILDETLIHVPKLPYELFADKGFEKYERRRELANCNCQVRMEMKNCDKNRKLGRRFVFTQEHKLVRGSIEKVVGWLKSFGSMILNKFRKLAFIRAMFHFCLSYVTYNRLQKL